MPQFLRYLAVAIFLTGVSAPTATAEPFRQDRFALGLWVPPQTKDDLEFRYRELAEANFNLVIGNSPVPVADQLRVCDHLGLKALVHVPGAVETWPTNASCCGTSPAWRIFRAWPSRLPTSDGCARGGWLT
jgi:hypothetical protein